MSDKIKKFLIVWNDAGLEAVLDISLHEQNHMIEKLTNPAKSTSCDQLIFSLCMRARLNSHRHYCFYFIETAGLSETDLFELYNQDRIAFESTIIKSGEKLPL